ncbi:hypothetical protein DM02DRAFT_671638 [Periconia macrospinosa]|uniref:Zn(2)-C6 fungal-type domain-containing protein n=1 Tax=Periconia macrospinosa TaxID=97972 RepID=A0A2V1DRR5_9PLEO|nr:hypothetical protein DM02DRAFT_671638 [Periconia macrospinosa]
MMTEFMSQACERCWRRKQKCSRDIPACIQCRNASSTCVRRRFGSTVHEPDAGSETSIEALKSRIQNMKALLQRNTLQNVPTAPQPLTPSRSTGLGSNVSQSTQSPTVDLQDENQAQQNTHETMPVNVAYLSLSAMAERTDGEPFSTEGFSYLTLLHAARSVSGSNPTLSDGENEFLTGTLAEFRRNESLNIDLGGPEMRASFEKYVDMVMFNFPFMLSSDLESTYESVVRPGNDVESIQPEKVALVYLGVATGLLLSSHYTYKEMLGAELALRAVRLMPQVLGCSNHIPAIQCLTALTIYSMYTSFGGSTWHLLGLLMTRCVSAGMHTSRPSRQYLNGTEQVQNRRELWTLYILDTYVSTVLDRPFSLNDRDLKASAPSSPPTRFRDVEVEGVIFHHLVQHAKMLRLMRQTPDPETGILCHFINIRYWAENMPKTSVNREQSEIALSARGYVELLKNPSFLLDPDRPKVIGQSIEYFVRYIDNVENQLNSQAAAVPSLDAITFFTIGVIISRFTPAEESTNILFDASMKVSQISNILSMLATRHAPIRSLRDILSALQRPTHSLEFKQHLQSLTANSEIVISTSIRNLILEEGGFS